MSRSGGSKSRAAPAELRIDTREWIYLAALLAAMVTTLSAMGRRAWCSLGDVAVSTWDVSSAHLSQHLLDPYSFTHVEHGVLFYALLRLLLPRTSVTLRFLGAITLAVGWEVLENSPWIIDRYREQTIDAGYYGDSILNSIADLGCCAIGFVFASRTRWWWSLALLVVFEVGLALTIRDNLSFNIIMLIYPLDAILAWQAARVVG